MRENDNGKGAEPIVFAEVQVVSFAAGLHADHFAGDAVSFANVLGGLVEGDAVGAEGRGGEKQGDRADAFHKKNFRSAHDRLREVPSKKEAGFPKKERHHGSMEKQVPPLARGFAPRIPMLGRNDKGQGWLIRSAGSAAPAKCNRLRIRRTGGLRTGNYAMQDLTPNSGFAWRYECVRKRENFALRL